MKVHSTAKPEQCRHYGSTDRSRHGQADLATAVADSRLEMEQQQGLLSLIAGSPRLQRKCACGVPSAAGGSCAACEEKATGAGPQGLQKKLAIGATNDPIEREADRVADQVMRMPEPTPTLMQTPSSQQPLMELLPLNAEKTLQRQSPDQDVETEREPLLLAKKETNQASEISPNLETQVQIIRGAGHPLPLSIRIFFEPRFDTDFSGVRLHTDRTADSLNRSLNARAFTSGNDVFFRKEEYDAGSTSGKWLLAHELTHVVQQRSKHGSSTHLGHLEKLPFQRIRAQGAPDGAMSLNC